MYHLVVAALSLATLAKCEPDTLERRLNNGVGVTPAMGWNNWNAGLGSTAATALATANLLVSLGLREKGYKYVNIDDTWSAKSRSNGLLVADPNKWPNGIKAVADQIHSLDLKFGLYGDSGTSTCSGFPGSQGYETTDANTIAGWGVDLWKYDNCATPSGSSIPRYQRMRDALLATGRPIYYALCNWGQDSVWTWGGETGNSWRVGGDITNSWSSAASIAANNAAIYSYAAPGGFNDFDMLEVGNGGMTTAEERAHFGIWAISKSPLILGTDLSKISSASLAIISNSDVIAINQDSLGKAAGIFTPPGKTTNKYYSGPLSDGYVIGMVATDSAGTMSTSFADVPGLGAGTYSWKECYTGATGTGTSVSANLASHDMAIFHVYKTGGPATTTKPVTTTGPTTTKPTTTTKPATTNTPPPTTTTGTGVSPKWGQCGGIGWTGPTVCVSGTSCKYSNDWYSQCL